MKSIFETIEKYQMIKAGMRVVAGVSGGADSVCLLYVLREYQKQIPFGLTVIHVEHGIRGEASLGDAVFTKRLCREMGIDCCVISADVQQTARERKLSVEEAGRRERYRIFEEFCRENGCDRIAVAHNQNDQAETLLWNLVRGSGLKGLGGIRPVRDRIIRPLLFTDREKIEQILKTAGISWRTDSTNLEQDYTRNRIRLSIIPQMEQELNARAGLHMAQAAQRLQQVQDYLDRMTDQAAKECIVKREGSAELLLEPFLCQDELIQTELLKRVLGMVRNRTGLKDISNVHLEMLRKLADMDCGKECHIPGVRAVREQGILRFGGCNGEKRKKCETSSSIRKKEVENTKKYSDNLRSPEYLLPVSGQQKIENLLIKTSLVEYDVSLMEEIREEKKYTKWLSYDTINNSVCLRKRKTGDYLVVNESGGRKKLKDYLIDCKIPKDRRDDLWLLADGSHILWVIGYRISSEMKVTRDTKKIWKIQIEEVTE